MPLYEYECRQCGERFEKLVSTSSAKKGTTCTKCGSTSVRKLMSACAPITTEASAISDCPTCPDGACGL